MNDAILICNVVTITGEIKLPLQNLLITVTISSHMRFSFI